MKASGICFKEAQCILIKKKHNFEGYCLWRYTFLVWFMNDLPSKCHVPSAARIKRWLMWSVSRSEKFSPQLWLFHSNRMWSAPPSWPTLRLWLSVPAVLGWVSRLPSALASLSVVLHCSRADFPAGLKTAAQTLRVSFLLSSALFTHSVTEVVCIFPSFIALCCVVTRKNGWIKNICKCQGMY